MSASSGLNTAQHRAIAALMAGATHETAAASAGKCVRTVRKWLRDERFQTELAERSRNVLAAAQQILQQRAADAATTLADMATGKIAANAARHSAARSVLELARNATEFDELEALVLELAAKLEARKGWPQ